VPHLGGAQAQTTYGPTGSTQVAQTTIPIPQDMIISGANTNSANAIVWTVWNDVYTNTVTLTSSPIYTASTVNMTTTNAVWGAWNAQLQQMNVAVTQAATSFLNEPINVTTGSSLTATVWTSWNNLIQTARTATAEQVAEAQRQAQAYHTQQAVLQVEKNLANDRAEKLLHEILNVKQREELSTKGFFSLETIAASGERRIYRIKRGRSRNVEQVDASGNRIKTLCAHPAELVPDADTMLAQKLMLESREEEFLRIANHS
jgi:hypothetical protein